MEFEWDNKKHQSNIKKHGVDFEEARSIFDDNFAIIIDDDTALSNCNLIFKYKGGDCDEPGTNI